MANLTEDAIMELIGLWQNFLKLNHWEISVTMRDRMENSKAAKVAADYRYHTAEIQMSKTVEEEEIERVIVHELLHLPIGAIRSVVHKFTDRITPMEYVLILDAEESAVELLARVLTETFTYLEAVKEEEKKEADKAERPSWY
ncbi:MAG: hypothetical protein J7K72_01105 [Candidatus Aenigmarchaeota archaeon]|nr:hypothetical protein [Candidatus Aenigmarchaeota archaeon]